VGAHPAIRYEDNNWGCDSGGIGGPVRGDGVLEEEKEETALEVDLWCRWVGRYIRCSMNEMCFLVRLCFHTVLLRITAPHSHVIMVGFSAASDGGGGGSLNLLVSFNPLSPFLLVVVVLIVVVVNDFDVIESSTWWRPRKLSALDISFELLSLL
jgi:hypothetical protein